MILDTLFLLFKTDAPGAKTDIDAIDKQIDQLTAKGKKRSDQENKQYAELKKQRKETLDSLKEQQRESEKLNNSFQSMVSGAVGAVTAYASFSALKAGLVDANNLNTSLRILQQTYGVSAVAAKAYGAAVERSTGIKAEVLYNFAAQGAAEAEKDKLPFDLVRVITNLRNRVKNLSPAAAQSYLQKTPGGSQLAPFLQLPEKDFNEAVKGGFSVAGKESDFKAAQENQEAVSKTSQAFGNIATQIDTQFHDAIKTATDALQGFAGALSGHPNVAAGAGVVGGVIASVGSVGLAKWAAGLLRIGAGGAADAAGTAAAGAAGVGLAFPALVAGSFYEAFFGDPEELGASFGRWVKGSNNSGDTSEPLAPGVDFSPKTDTAKSNKQRIMEFWLANGYGPGAAAGFTANAQAESSFNPLAGLGSGHVGLYQWDAKRQAKIRGATGIDVSTAGLDDQLRAALWDAQTNYGLKPGAFPSGAGASAALVSNKFEVPSLTKSGLAALAAKRARIAEGYNIPFGIASGSGEAGAGKTISVKVDDINVHTQATDAEGIAREVGTELKNQIRMAMSTIDDGVNF